jgi:hypothetical protein
MRDDYPVYGTQGGGLARNVNGVFIFIERPRGQPTLNVGDDVPVEWDMVPANQKARDEVDYNIKDEMPKEYVIRVVITEGDLSDQEFSGLSKIIESLRYAGLLVTHENEGLTILCFDIKSPIHVRNTKQWSKQNAERMRSFGYNAVSAPSAE